MLLNFPYQVSKSSIPCISRLSNVYHRFGCTVNLILPLSILPHPLLLFTGVKKWVFWPRSLTPLFFEPPSFQNEATHRYQSILFGAAMMELCSSQIWCGLVHPLWGVEFECPSSLKNLLNRSTVIQSLNTRHAMYYKRSRLRCQRSRSQHDIMYQHQKIITCYEQIGWMN